MRSRDLFTTPRAVVKWVHHAGAVVLCPTLLETRYFKSNRWLGLLLTGDPTGEIDLFENGDIVISWWLVSFRKAAVTLVDFIRK